MSRYPTSGAWALRILIQSSREVCGLIKRIGSVALKLPRIGQQPGIGRDGRARQYFLRSGQTLGGFCLSAKLLLATAGPQQSFSSPTVGWIEFAPKTVGCRKKRLSLDRVSERKVYTA